jgi:hypothetical protein
MSDYISREMVLKTLQKANIGGYITERLLEIPAADVQLVKHAHWKQIGIQSAICSLCGGALKSNGADRTGRALIFNAVYKYCPECGARMDGDAEGRCEK